MFNNQVMCRDGFPKIVKRETPVTLLCVEDDTLAMTAILMLYNRVNNLEIEIKTTKTEKHITDGLSINNKVYSFYFFSGIKNENDVEEMLKEFPHLKIEKLPAHEKFIKEQLKKDVYIRLMPNENNVCVFTPALTLPIFHLVQSFIPKFFPIFKDKPLTKEEKSFLETLTYKTSMNYETKLTELINTEEFRTYCLTSVLGSIEKKLFEKKVIAARASLNRYLSDMEEFMRRYKETYKKYQEAEYLAQGLEATAAERGERSELQEYLIGNKRLTNISINNDHIEFIVKTYLAPHHVEEWDSLNRRKMAERYKHSLFSSEEIAMLLDSIFSKERCLKLKICSYISMDYFGSEVYSGQGYNFVGNNPDMKNYVPNGHLHHHNCFGQNKTDILNLLKEGDVVGAIECCISCTQRMNIHEDFSFRPFVEDLLNCKGKCLVAKDGTEMTPKEAIEYLKGKQNA